MKIKIITLDTETYDGMIGKLKRIAIYDGKKVYYGYKFRDIENILINYRDAGYQVHVYIHNMEFDLRKIPVVFEQDRAVWNKSMIINNRLVKYVSDGVIYQDSFMLLPSSLSELSKDFEVKHGKLNLWEEVQKTYPGEYKNIVDFLDRCHVDDELFVKYLGYDVMSLYEIIYKLMEMVNIDISKFVNLYTTSSLSRYIFKNGYSGVGVDKPIKFKRENAKRTDYQNACTYKWKNDELEEFVRLGYCGGRCEVFKQLLQVPGYYYDFNSLYPFEMFMHRYPIGKPEFSSNEWTCRREFERYQSKIKQGIELFGFINCRVWVPEQNIPPLPVQMGKLTFPTGDICGVWTFQELDYAIQTCGCEIIEYYSICTFSLSFPVFENFVGLFAELKEQAGKDKKNAWKALFKRILNVGYGYFGMSRDNKFKLDSIKNLKEYKNNDIFFIDTDLGFLEIYSDVDGEYIQPQIAAYVTSYARMEWLKTAKMIESMGGNIYYGDTDSIITDIELPADMVDDYRLGKLSLEYKLSEGIFIKPKVYGMKLADGDKTKEKLKFKGISRDTLGDYSYEHYRVMYNMQTQGDKELVVEKGRHVLRSIMYLTKNHIDYGSYETRDKKIYFDRKEKRVFDYDNNTSKPWHFKTIDDFMSFEYNNVQDVILK